MLHKKQLILKLDGIGKKYSLKVGQSTPRDLINRIVRQTGKEEFWALKDINLNVYKGEKIGIVGKNGAGKTTLLRIITGITSPTTGDLSVHGHVVALIDLEAGFNPDLTGKENILVNGLLIGMTKDEIYKKFDEIIEYADIGNFIDAPFYTYSNGMKFRLAFAIAIVSECDILIIDEIFMVGDHEFQAKIFDSIKSLQRKNKEITTIMCSHAPVLVWGFAKKFYQLINGKLYAITSEKMWKDTVEKDSKMRKFLKLEGIYNH